MAVKTLPTQRSLAYLKKLGYRTAIVEKWNPHARIRQDLFGFIDLIALKGTETLAVQTTSAGNMAARVKKIMEIESAPDVRMAGWKIVVHGWRKSAKGGWVLKEILL